MRTSLNEIKQIEEYLSGQTSDEDAALFQANLILQPALHDNMLWQQKTYDIIRQYSRLQLKAELQAVQQKVFADRSFLAKIKAIFS